MTRSALAHTRPRRRPSRIATSRARASAFWPTKRKNYVCAWNLLLVLKPWYGAREVPMSAYPLDKLRFDQPSLWLPLAMHACRVACNAAAGQSTTFEVSRFADEQHEPAIESLSIVHADELPGQLPVVSASASNEWLQIAAATVIGVFLRKTMSTHIQCVCRSENGLSFYLEPGDSAEDCLLIVVGSAQHDAREALDRAIEVAGAIPCAHKIAAAVAFGSNKAALRVLS
jgi:hypothetical protein